MKRVCIVCRHPLDDERDCDQPGHTDVADLHPMATPPGAGRERLVAAVWGTHEQRARRVQLVASRGRTAAVVGGTTGVIAGVGAMFVIGDVMPLIAATGIFVGTAAGTMASLIRRRGDDVELPRPAGPLTPPPVFARGTIIGASDDLRSPASGLWAPAWAMVLTLARPGGPRVVFRDAATAALEVRLDDGTRARVPAGPWHPARGLVPLLDIDELTVTGHLRSVDAAYQPHDEISPFHHDVVLEALLQIGDRIELCGTWHPRPDPQRASDPLYRDAPATLLVPDGWPWLRRARI